MDNQKEHHELMTRLAVLEATFTGKFDNIINHLAQLNGQTSKNSGAIEQLQNQDRDILAIVTRQKKNDEAQQIRNESWKKSWKDLLFGSLQWLVPAIIIGLLINGRAIAEFLGFVK